MNTQQRNQERIRLWEMDRDAAIEHCARVNDMRIHGCHFWGTLGNCVEVSIADPEESLKPGDRFSLDVVNLVNPEE